MFEHMTDDLDNATTETRTQFLIVLNALVEHCPGDVFKRLSSEYTDGVELLIGMLPIAT